MSHSTGWKHLKQRSWATLSLALLCIVICFLPVVVSGGLVLLLQLTGLWLLLCSSSAQRFFFLIPTRTPVLSALHSAILPGTPASRFPSRFRSSCDREMQRADTFEGEMQRCQSCCIASLSHLLQQPTSCLFKTKGPRRKERNGLSSGSKSAARVGANNNKLQEKQKKNTFLISNRNGSGVASQKN